VDEGSCTWEQGQDLKPGLQSHKWGSGVGTCPAHTVRKTDRIHQFLQLRVRPLESIPHLLRTRPSDGVADQVQQRGAAVIGLESHVSYRKSSRRG
jgi:hypothetical protein